MSVLISVIVPIYNIDKYLNQCVKSLLENTCDCLEIILVDDGSKDLSGEMCDVFVLDDPRIKVLHKRNGGLTSSREMGILSACGEYVMIVDGDDWLDSDALAVLAENADRYQGIDLIAFSHKKEYPTHSYIRHLFEKDNMFDNPDSVRKGIYRRLFGLTNAELDHPESMDYLSTCWGKLYRRNLALNAKFVDTSEVGSGEDAIFNMYALDSCKSAMYLDRPFYSYRYTAGSLTVRYRDNFASQWEILFSYMQKKIEDDGLGPDFQEALNNRIALSVLGMAMNELDNPDGSFLQFAGFMKKYISSRQYRAAVATMRLKKLPMAWKILMLCCKCRFSFGAALILKAVRIIKSKL